MVSMYFTKFENFPTKNTLLYHTNVHACDSKLMIMQRFPSFGSVKQIIKMRKKITKIIFRTFYFSNHYKMSRYTEIAVICYWFISYEIT